MTSAVILSGTESNFQIGMSCVNDAPTVVLLLDGRGILMDVASPMKLGKDDMCSGTTIPTTS